MLWSILNVRGSTLQLSLFFSVSLLRGMTVVGIGYRVFFKDTDTYGELSEISYCPVHDIIALT